MDIGSEVFSMALALRLPRSTLSPTTTDFSNLKLFETPLSGTFNSDSDSLEPSRSPYNETFEWSEMELLYRHSVTLTAVYCVAYLIVFTVGLIGNSFVIAVVFRAPRMRTVTNFFIVNLALADILVIVFCLPATLMSNIFVPWMLGSLMCKTVPYIQGVSVAASVYSLIAVSLDRFLAIWWPLKLQITKKRARLMILCIWILALCSTIPWALFFELVSVYPEDPDLKLCLEVWPPGTNGAIYFLVANLVVCYLLPMVFISLCYILIFVKVCRRSIPGDNKDAQIDRMQQKSKVKVVKMLVVVVILFILSWLPLYVIFARIKFGGVMDSREEEVLQIVTPIAQWLGSSNSCINPILYAFFNKKYRLGFAGIVKSRKCCGRLRYYDNVTIASSTTSTRKSSQYQNNNNNNNNQSSTKRYPYSPPAKSESVSYIYDNSSTKRHNIIAKQDSNLSKQMLVKQDSILSNQSIISGRQAVIKQGNSIVARQDSNNSRQLLLKQDSNGSGNVLTKQDSQISYIDTKKNQLLRQDSDLSKRDYFAKQENVISCIDPRRGLLNKQETQISYIDSKKSSFSSQDSIVSFVEHKRHQLVKQDSVISFADQKPEPRRHQLVKQDSIISYADHRRGYLTKQDSVIGYPYNRYGEGHHHVSILKKTDSIGSSSSSSRKSIEFLDM